jgi:hypothetical protein
VEGVHEIAEVEVERHLQCLDAVVFRLDGQAERNAIASISAPARTGRCPVGLSPTCP